MSRASPSIAAFFFIAATPSGGRKLGMRSARSERALAEGLRRERLVIVKSWRLPSWLATAPGDMPLKDRAEVHQQLSMLLGRGVPLVEALEVTASVVATQTRGTVERMRELVGAGSSFSEACRQVRAFDSVTVAVYQAAEKTGDLAGAADLLATAARRQMAVRGQATGVLAYPVIVFSISVLIVLFMLISVVPQIGEALTNLTTFDELPAITKVVLTASDVLRNNLAAFGIGVLVLFTLLVLGRKIWVPAVNSVVRRLPAMRGLILAQESARFFMVLSAMTRSGVPLADSLGVAVGSLHEKKLSSQMRKLRLRLIEGGVLTQLIERVEALPLATRRLIVAADKAGDLDAAFERLADDFADAVKQRTDALLAVLQPASIILLFSLVAPIIFAILVPLLTLPQTIG